MDGRRRRGHQHQRHHLLRWRKTQTHLPRHSQEGTFERHFSAALIRRYYGTNYTVLPEGRFAGYCSFCGSLCCVCALPSCVTELPAHSYRQRQREGDLFLLPESAERESALHSLRAGGSGAGGRRARRARRRRGRREPLSLSPWCHHKLRRKNQKIDKSTYKRSHFIFPKCTTSIKKVSE